MSYHNRAWILSDDIQSAPSNDLLTTVEDAKILNYSDIVGLQKDGDKIGKYKIRKIITTVLCFKLNDHDFSYMHVAPIIHNNHIVKFFEINVMKDKDKMCDSIGAIVPTNEWADMLMYVRSVFNVMLSFGYVDTDCERKFFNIKNLSSILHLIRYTEPLVFSYDISLMNIKINDFVRKVCFANFTLYVTKAGRVFNNSTKTEQQITLDMYNYLENCKVFEHMFYLHQVY